MNSNYALRRLLPNFFTFANMFCGFIAVVAVHQQNYYIAVLLIAIAAVADSLDGLMARLTKTSSRFGVELDSLADVISFGFAPAFLIYSTELYQLHPWGLLAAGLFLFAGAFRLARFNIELVGYDKNYFKGLPIPTSALTLTSFVFLRTSWENHSPISAYTSLLLVISLAYLMVSHIKYDTLPAITIEGLKQKPVFTAFLFIALILTIATQGTALFYVFIIFIVFGIFRYIISFFKSGANSQLNTPK